MIPELAAWQQRWNLPPQAMGELALALVPLPSAAVSATSEGATQAKLRGDAPYLSCHLWRNNNGAWSERDPQGKVTRVVRYGVANDSEKINNVFKSSDLIGITPVKILPHQVGKTMGIFTAIEVKKPSWTRPENDRDKAQANFIKAINSNGGLGSFITDPSQYKVLVEGFRK